MEVKRCFGRIIKHHSTGMVLFILSDLGKKRGRKPRRAALVFSHAGKKRGKKYD